MIQRVWCKLLVCELKILSKNSRVWKRKQLGSGTVSKHADHAFSWEIGAQIKDKASSQTYRRFFQLWFLRLNLNINTPRWLLNNTVEWQLWLVGIFLFLQWLNGNSFVAGLKCIYFWEIPDVVIRSTKQNSVPSFSLKSSHYVHDSRLNAYHIYSWYYQI